MSVFQAAFQYVAISMCILGAIATVCLVAITFIAIVAVLSGEKMRPGAAQSLIGMLIFFPGVFFFFIPIAMPTFPHLYGLDAVQLYAGGLAATAIGILVMGRDGFGARRSA